MNLAEYLNRKASDLLEAKPFSEWPVERSVDLDADPLSVGYVFKGRGLQVNCDLHDEIVRSIFIESEMEAGTVLSEVPFDYGREQVLMKFGSPSKSGVGFTDPILGEFGPWDRFHGPEYTVHIQYQVENDHIKMVTLMRNDVAP